MIKKLLAGLFCGMFAGAFALGVGGRMIMRALTMITGRDPEFSFGGTIEVVIFAAIIGSIAGAAFVVIKKYLPGAAPLKGLLFGALVFIAVVIVRPPSVVRSASAFEDYLWPVVLMFCPAFLIYGIVLAAAEKGLSRRFGSNEEIQKSN